jgi:hypothetical protein
MGASSTQEYCRKCGEKALRGRYYKEGNLLIRQVLCEVCIKPYSIKTIQPQKESVN